MALQAFRQNIDSYTKGKTWYWYVPGWLFGLYLFVKLLDFELGGHSNSFFVLVMQSLNFFLHETAHLFTVFLPDVLTAAAGSGSELLLGLGLIIGGFVGRTYFASLFGFLWFMLGAQSTADYMADAVPQSIPLVSFGGSDPTHDWNFIFTELGVLEQSQLIASMMRWSGILAGAFGLGFALYLIIRMHLAKSAAVSEARMEAVRQEIMDRKQTTDPPKPNPAKDIYPTARG